MITKQNWTNLFKSIPFLLNLFPAIMLTFECIFVDLTVNEIIFYGGVASLNWGIVIFEIYKIFHYPKIK